MNLTTTSVTTMSSREIAVLVDSTHDSVLKTIRRLVSEGVVFGTETPYTHEQNGQTYSEFKLSFRDTMIVASGYNSRMRAKIIDRWQVLENAQPQFNPATLTRMDILKMALDSEERAVKAEAKVVTLETVVQDQVPKVEALARIATSDGLMCITDAAKSLQIQPKRLFGWMQQHQWIYRRAGGSGFVGYQNRIQSGCLSHKVVTIDCSDGSTSTKEQVLVTAKGLTKLAESIDLH